MRLSTNTADQNKPTTQVIAIATLLALLLFTDMIFADDLADLHQLTETELTQKNLLDPTNVDIQLVRIRKIGQIRQPEAVKLLSLINTKDLNQSQSLYFDAMNCTVLIRMGSMDKATPYCESVKAKIDADESNNLSTAIAYNALGYYDVRNGRTKLALDNFEYGLARVSGQEVPSLRVMLLHNRGVTLMLSGLTDLAVKAFEEANTQKGFLAKDDPLPNLLAYNLGYLQAQSGKHQEALKSYALMLPWAKETGQTAREFLIHIQIAFSLAALDQYQDALDELLPWILRKDITVTPDSEAQAYLATAYAYIGLNNRPRASYYLSKGIKLAQVFNNSTRLSELALALATMLIEDKHFTSARDELTKLLASLDQNDTNEGRAQANKLLGDAYAGLGDFKMAYQHGNAATKAQHKAESGAFNQRLASLRASNEIDVKNQQLKLSLEREKATNASQQLVEFYQITTIAALLLLIAIIYLYNEHRNRKLEAELQANLTQRLKEEVDVRTNEVKEELEKRYIAEQAQAHSELMLVKDDKLRSIGQLTGGVAHDFNNLMTIVLLSAEVLLPELDDEQQTLAKDIIAAALSGKSITHDLLAYARQQALRPSQINLNEYFQKNNSLFQRSVDESIQLNIIPSPETGIIIRADEGQLTSCLINLIFNAREASSVNSIIDISLNRKAGKALIQVGDHGHGMSKAEIEVATEPFYSTKDESEGTGLGLSMVYGFIKQSGGELHIESQLNIGTTITLEFNDISKDLVVDADQGYQKNSRKEKSATILFVEDEPRIREVGQLALRRAGYKVILAEDGDTAANIIKSNIDIDLVVSDLVMPGSTSGEQLAALTQVARPNLPILLMSGYAKDIPVGYTFLAKPFSLSELTNAVQKELSDVKI